METEEEDKDGGFSRITFKMQSEKSEEVLLGKKKKIDCTEFNLKMNIFNFELVSILY